MRRACFPIPGLRPGLIEPAFQAVRFMCVPEADIPSAHVRGRDISISEALGIGSSYILFCFKHQTAKTVPVAFSGRIASPQ